MTAFGEKLRKLLSELKINQRELARRTGISPSLINHWVHGKRLDIAPLWCLYFAGMTRDPQDRDFWLTQSGIDEKQFLLLTGALALSPYIPAAEVPPRWREQLRRICQSGNATAMSIVEQSLTMSAGILQGTDTITAPTAKDSQRTTRPKKH